MTDVEFKQWLLRKEERCILVEMDYVYESDSPAGPTVGTRYFSDRVFFDDVTDNAYVDVVKSAPQYSRSLSGDDLSSYTSSIGSLELDNANGQLDDLLNLSCDGSAIRFYYGGTDWLAADFKHIFSAIVAKITAPTYDRISVALKDTGLLLNKSIGGTTTMGGIGPNANRPRPANIGYVHNLTALIQDESLLKYVHSDSGTAAAVEVRDRGVSVGFTDNADGTFTLFASPDGTVTVDVFADPDGSGNVPVSDVMDHWMGDLSGLTALGLYAGAGPTFIVGDADDYRLGISLSEPRNAITLLNEINESGNCFGAFKRTGEFTYGRLRLNDIAAFGLTPTDIYKDELQAESGVQQAKFNLDHAPTKYYKYQGYMSRNWSRQTDFASLLSPDQQAVYSRPGLYLMQPDGTGTDYANAPEQYHKTLEVSPVIDTLLSEPFSDTDLDSLAQWMMRRRSMLLPWIEIVTNLVGIYLYELELGDPVRLFQDRYGEDAGTLFQVIGIVLRLSDAKMELRLARRNIIQATPASWTPEPTPIETPAPPYAPGSPIETPENPIIITIDPGPGPIISSDNNKVVHVKPKRVSVSVGAAFSVALWNGNNTAPRTISAINLSQGGVIFIRRRDATDTPRMYLSANGSTVYGADTIGSPASTYASPPITFGSGGFTLTSTVHNGSAATYEAWCFKRGPRFCDVIAYTGNGSDARTVAHSVTMIPGRLLVTRVDGTVNDQGIRSYDLNVGNTKAAIFATTDFALSDNWNNTSPTASEFTVRSHSGGTQVNGNAIPYAAVVFAHDTATDGAIKLCSWVGNGSATGPIVTLGWQPQCIFGIKDYIGVASTNNTVWDTTRTPGFSGNDARSYLGLSNIEDTINAIALVSGGFQLVTASAEVNANTVTYTAMVIKA